MVAARDMASDPNIVGNVRQDGTGGGAGHELRHQVGVARIAARDPVRTKREDVARFRDWLQCGVGLERALLVSIRLLI
jgi:hypothetical protein